MKRESTRINLKKRGETGRKRKNGKKKTGSNGEKQEEGGRNWGNGKWEEVERNMKETVKKH